MLIDLKFVPLEVQCLSCSSLIGKEINFWGEATVEKRKIFRNFFLDFFKDFTLTKELFQLFSAPR